MRGRIILIFGAAAVLAAAAIVLALSRGRTAAPLAKPAARPNVLLISMDTTRADYLACYGHPRVKTPSMDRLASQGALFEQCTTVAPMTLPAHASLLTGTYPFVHGARDNNQFHLHEKNVTLAEALREAGYATTAQIASPVLARSYGLDQGFDSYIDLPARKIKGRERRAADVCEAATTWLQQNPGRPFFMFLHFNDPHQPFDPPPPFDEQYRFPYLGEIAYLDQQIGRLLDALREMGAQENTLVVLTADHGESLEEHGESTHGAFLYDCTTRIPLIMRWPGRFPGGARIRAQVRLVDVAPTILDLAGLPPLGDAQGVSLAALLSGGADPGLAAYSEAMYPLLNLGLSQIRALRAGGWKYIHTARPELYHVAEDAAELVNLIDAQPDRAASMREAIRRIIESAPVVVQADQGRREMSAAETRSLQTLGYAAGETGAAWTEGTRELDLFDPIGDDAKDHPAEIQRVNECIGLVQDKKFDQAEPLLVGLVAAAGERGASFRVHILLGQVMAETGRFEEAVQQYRNALARRPDHPEALSELGLSLGKLGRLDESIEALQKRVRIKPVYASSYLNLAVALRLKNRHRAAQTAAEKAVELDPNLAGAHAQLAVLLAQLGRTADALASMRRAVELDPGNQEFAQELRRMEQPRTGGG